MKLRSRTNGLVALTRVRDELRSAVARFEENAASCETCTTRGECCRDEHFVNVRVTAIEAEAIRSAVVALPTKLRDEVYARAEVAANALSTAANAGDDRQTYSCPLYDAELQCLVHTKAKPAACIVHACYESADDLPPDDLLETAERAAIEISRSVYGKDIAAVAIPFAIEQTASPVRVSRE